MSTKDRLIHLGEAAGVAGVIAFVITVQNDPGVFGGIFAPIVVAVCTVAVTWLKRHGASS